MTTGRVRWGVALLIAALVLPAFAGDEENLRELELAEKRVKQLLNKAEELQDAGRHEEAKAALKQADDLRAAIKRSRAHLERRRKHAELGGEAREILAGLEAGAAALRHLKKFDEAERLQKIAANVEEELAQRNRRRERGERTERQVAEHQLEVLRIAFHAFREAEKKDAAEVMEHAIHARELALEGRRDKEAIHVRETAPKRGQQAEMLLMAAELWADWGKEDKAEACAKLGRKFAEKTERRRREHREGGEKERGRREHLEAAMHKIERLHDRLAALEKTIEELHAQLQALKRDR